MSTPKCIVVDFETEGIKARPDYPPKPVGVSIRWPQEKKSRYWAWGHPTKNNCTQAEGRRAVKDVWRSGLPLAFQNGKFDVDVAETYLDTPKIEWDRIHDTLFLLFLQDPYARSLSLKPSAERILGMKPTERDAVRDWLLEHEKGVTKKNWGAFICKAPGDLVGEYADGDVLRTKKLFEKLHPEICNRNMQRAYDRERQLMPIMLRNEREGVRIYLRKLERDIIIYQAALDKADAWLRKRLKVDTKFNIDADQDMADALENAGVVTEWAYTAPTKRNPQGVRSVSKKNLTPDMFHDKRVASVFGYRNILSTCLGTFMLPWLEVARETNGIIYTSWNQVRGPEGGGARTGRFSSSPNFQNIPKNWKKAIADGYVYPAFLGVPELPSMRSYFLPDAADHLWGRRDYNQQELRLLAHYEDGELLQRYLDDPRLDIHALVQQYILEIVGLDLPREPVKILNFADIYGRGLGTLAEAMHVDIKTAQALRRAKNKLLPGIAGLNEAIIALAKSGEPIRTWGGREYYVEPSGFSKKYKRMMDFYYKLLNYLIQGSASDVTKESIIRYDSHPKKRGRFLITVHDENNISAHKKVFKQEMLLLRDVMQSVEVDVPMLSDGEGGRNWGALSALKEQPSAN